MSRSADRQVYLIDEDEAVRDSLKLLLESHGLQVQDFRGSTGFLSGIKVTDVGCLILGFNRLIVSGRELMRVLQQRGIGIPVIFVVGGGDALIKAAALACGAYAYLERPLEEAMLIRTVEAALAHANRARTMRPLLV